jgi:hypothetical protein
MRVAHLILLAIVASLVCQSPAFAQVDFRKLRKDAQLRQDVRDAIDKKVDADHKNGQQGRDVAMEIVDATTEQVSLLNEFLDQWQKDVEPLLRDDTGRRIAGNAELRNSFRTVYQELADEYANARSQDSAADQLCRETRKFLKNHNDDESTYRPSYTFLRRIEIIGRELNALSRRFEPALTKVDLWTQIAQGQPPADQILDEFLEPKPSDRRAPAEIGEEQHFLRKAAYQRVAYGFSQTLTAEAGARQGAGQVETIGVMTGKLVSKRNQPTLSVTFQLIERNQNAFSGKMFLNTGDAVSNMSGRIDSDTFQCLIQASSRRLELSGTLKGDDVTGTWKSLSRDRDYGSFQISLTRIKAATDKDKKGSD